MSARNDRQAERELRLRLRQSYGCDCAGPVAGRINPRMTDGILSTAAEWTGLRPRTCPWRAFYKPFTQRVLHAYRFFESGQLAWVEPDPSYKLVTGVAHYHTAMGRARIAQMEVDRINRRPDVPGATVVRG